MDFSFAEKHYKALYAYLDADAVDEDSITAMLNDAVIRDSGVLYRSIFINHADHDWDEICRRISNRGVISVFDAEELTKSQARICSTSFDELASIQGCSSTHSVSNIGGHIITFKITNAKVVFDFNDIVEFVRVHTKRLNQYESDWLLRGNYSRNYERIFKEKECIILSEGFESEMVRIITPSEFKKTFMFSERMKTFIKIKGDSNEI